LKLWRTLKVKDLAHLVVGASAIYILEMVLKIYVESLIPPPYSRARILLW